LLRRYALIVTLAESANPPLAAVQALAATVRSGIKTETPADALIANASFLQLSNALDALACTVGACERVKNTPTPFGYVAALRGATTDQTIAWPRWPLSLLSKAPRWPLSPLSNVQLWPLAGVAGVAARKGPSEARALSLRSSQLFCYCGSSRCPSRSLASTGSSPCPRWCVACGHTPRPCHSARIASELPA
jgi:hypothetical protein